MTVHFFIGALAFLGFILLTYSGASIIAWLRGYQKGWQDAEEWLAKMETEVEETERDLWRERLP